MSLISYKKMFIIAGSALLLTGTLAGGLLITANANPLQNSEMKSALESGDLNAFKQAIVTQAKGNAEKRAENITEEKFKEMQENYKNQQAIQTAIENKDYNAFKAAVADKTNLPEHLKSIDSEEKFNKLVEVKAKQDEFKTKINEALKSENKEAFKTILKEHRDYMEANVAEDLRGNKKDRPELTDEQIDKVYTRALEMVKNGQEFDFGNGKMMQGHDKKGMGDKKMEKGKKRMESRMER